MDGGGSVRRMNILIPEAGVALAATLNDSATADELWNALPVESPAQTWGAEVYFTVPVELGPEDPQATVGQGHSAADEHDQGADPDEADERVEIGSDRVAAARLRIADHEVEVAAP